MPISLYDAVVPSSLQILRAVDRLLDKAEAFCTETGKAPAALIDARLAPDMLPLGYQVKACTTHSIGGIKGARAGEFTPDRSAWPTDFTGLHAILAAAIADMEGINRDTFDQLADSDTHFVSGERRLPFTGTDFLLSFSQPNFYFHASTAYAILRMAGVPLGKRDFLGAPRIKG